MTEVPLGERLDALLAAPLFPYRDNFDALGSMLDELEDARRAVYRKRALICREMFTEGASWREISRVLAVPATTAERLGKSVVPTPTTSEGPS